jgi:chromosome segregation ATPase
VVVGELPALREKVERATTLLQGLEDEIFSLRNEYRLVGELSLKVLKTVEDDRKQVQQAVEPWQREEGTSAMRHATMRLDMVEASKAEVDAKLERTEKRLAITEAAQEHNLEPKIDKLEDKIQKVQSHEKELRELIHNNTGRLDQIDVQCSRVNKWMHALANPGGADVFEGMGDDAQETEKPVHDGGGPVHHEHHHHHEHHTPTAA